MEPTDNESLVDVKLLSYAYLEAGMIETLAWSVLPLFAFVTLDSFLLV